MDNRNLGPRITARILTQRSVFIHFPSMLFAFPYHGPFSRPSGLPPLATTHIWNFPLEIVGKLFLLFSILSLYCNSIIENSLEKIYPNAFRDDKIKLIEAR